MTEPPHILSSTTIARSAMRVTRYLEKNGMRATSARDAATWMRSWPTGGST